MENCVIISYVSINKLNFICAAGNCVFNFLYLIYKTFFNLISYRIIRAGVYGHFWYEMNANVLFKINGGWQKNFQKYRNAL
jgi:hypothetical protein